MMRFQSSNDIIWMNRNTKKDINFSYRQGDRSEKYQIPYNIKSHSFIVES